jgi:hypothetical protein
MNEALACAAELKRKLMHPTFLKHALSMPEQPAPPLEQFNNRNVSASRHAPLMAKQSLPVIKIHDNGEVSTSKRHRCVRCPCVHKTMRVYRAHPYSDSGSDSSRSGSPYSRVGARLPAVSSGGSVGGCLSPMSALTHTRIPSPGESGPRSR